MGVLVNERMPSEYLKKEENRTLKTRLREVISNNERILLGEGMKNARGELDGLGLIQHKKKESCLVC